MLPWWDVGATRTQHLLHAQAHAAHGRRGRSTCTAWCCAWTSPTQVTHARQAQAQVTHTQAQPGSHAQPSTWRARQPPCSQELLCLLEGVGLSLQVQRQLLVAQLAVQGHLGLLLLHCCPVLAQSALQVEGQGHAGCERRLCGSRVGQWQLHIVLGLQAPWLKLGRQPGLLLQQLSLSLGLGHCCSSWCLLLGTCALWPALQVLLLALLLKLQLALLLLQLLLACLLAECLSLLTLLRLLQLLLLALRLLHLRLALLLLQLLLALLVEQHSLLLPLLVLDHLLLPLLLFELPLRLLLGGSRLLLLLLPCGGCLLVAPHHKCQQRLQLLQRLGSRQQGPEVVQLFDAGQHMPPLLSQGGHKALIGGQQHIQNLGEAVALVLLTQ